MASQDDAKDNDPDRLASAFGPPVSDSAGAPGREFAGPESEFGPPMGEFGPAVSEFGPPVSEFGPPVSGFGPPVGEFRAPPAESGPPQWSEPAADHPELVWRPAEETSAPQVQYRAPDSQVFPTSQDREPPWTPAPDSGAVPIAPPPPKTPELPWSQDQIVQRLAPAYQRKSGTKRRPTGWVVGGVAAALAAIIGLALVIVAVTRSGGGTETTAAAPPTGAKATLSCPAGRDGKLTVGNGAGDTASGPGAILGFQYGFYVTRSGVQARRFVAADNLNVSTAEIIQKAIDEQIPVGTTHCVRIAETAPRTFDVDLTERRPDGSTSVYQQTVLTVNRDGKELVYSIKNRGE
ncbi:hypothetical protein [Nocardia panacis]|uniref:hypothetical protein n=1 Tax=Nocardia panacis TaxID=2340916 RepID=UPI001EEFDCF2|nr:hypothetical protein [Nocardia panacis]